MSVGKKEKVPPLRRCVCALLIVSVVLKVLSWSFVGPCPLPARSSSLSASSLPSLCQSYLHGGGCEGGLAISVPDQMRKNPSVLHRSKNRWPTSFIGNVAHLVVGARLVSLNICFEKEKKIQGCSCICQTSCLQLLNGNTILMRLNQLVVQLENDPWNTALVTKNYYPDHVFFFTWNETDSVLKLQLSFAPVQTAFS